MINAGISGETAEQVAARFSSDAIDSDADTVVILAGTNDILKLAVEQMAMQARDANMKVIVGLIPPTEQGLGNSMVRVSDYNQALSEWCADNDFEVANYFAVLDLATDFVDGIHPNAQGYSKMWQVISPPLSMATNQ